MRTRYVTTVPLDAARLEKDLRHSESFHYSEAYSDYLIGGPWKNVTLWARGGDAGDGVLTNYAYDQAATFTEYGAQLPYLQELITTTVDTTRLNFVRLARISHSVIVPHRDFLELGDIAEDVRSAHRLHIPLVTHEDCHFSEDNTVYRMRAGEVWFFDASRIHSVASLTDAERIHLVFDFVDRAEGGPLVTVADDGYGDGVPADRAVARPPLSDSDRGALLGLADVLTMDTFAEVFGIVIKTHFRYDGGDDFVWSTMTAIGSACTDPAVLPHTLELHRYYTLERSASKEWMSMTTTLSFGDRLAESPVYQKFRDHPFFTAVDSATLTKEQAAILIEQWWHPLHYFPTFLARCVAVLPDIASKSAITRILNQETGDGDVTRAHEAVYVESMDKCGFDRDSVTGTAPYPETAALVEGYRTASGAPESALGFIFATETTDLLMVSSIGTAIERTTGVSDNEWVAIHVEQEPDHVAEANHALLADFSAEEEDRVVVAADEMWQLWTAFFDRLVVDADIKATAPAR